MRFVYFPMYSNQSLNNCSTFNWAKDFVRNVTRAHDDAYIYWVLPKYGDGTRWEMKREWVEGSIPRVKELYFDLEFKQYDQIMLMPHEWYDHFHAGKGKYYYQAMLIEHAPIAPLIHKLSTVYVQKYSFSFPIFVNHGFLMTWGTHSYIPAELELLEATGMAFSYNIFNTQENYQRGIDMARRYLAHSLIDRIEQNSRVIYTGINTREIDEILEGTGGKRNDKFTLVYANRMTNGYSVRDVMDVYGYFYKSGKDVKILVVTPTEGRKDLLPENPDIEYYEHLQRHQYLRKAAKAHAFMMAAKRSEFNLTIFELMYAGLAGVIIDAEWSRRLLPDWYPWRFKTFPEGYAMLDYIRENWGRPEVQDNIKRMREFIYENYNNEKTSEEIYQWMQEEYEKRLHSYEYLKISDGIYRELNQTILSFPPPTPTFTMQYVVDEIKRVCGTDITVVNERFPINKLYYYYALEAFGYKDNCQEEMPVFPSRPVKKG